MNRLDLLKVTEEGKKKCQPKAAVRRQTAGNNPES